MRLPILIGVVVLGLILNFFIAREFYRAAVMKGWARRKYFFFAFFLPVIGYLLVIALPDRGSAADGSFESAELPDI